MFAINSIHVENFKIFTDITADFHDKGHNPKSLVVIYGSNGGGKTSLMEAFAFIQRSMLTMKNQRSFNEIIDNPKDLFSKSPIKMEYILDSVKRNYTENTIESITRKFIKINAKSNLVVKIEFALDGFLGSYYIENSKKGIEREELYLTLHQNKVKCYSYNQGEVYIHDTLLEREYYKAILEKIHMYQQKHSFLSIIYDEILDKADSYIKKSINERLVSFAKHIGGQCFFLNPSALGLDLNEPGLNRVLNNLGGGIISADDKDILELVEKDLSPLLSSVFEDVQAVEYEIENLEAKNGEVKYRLILEKIIDGEICRISYDKESVGVKRIIGMLPYLVSAIRGEVVFVDEFGESMNEIMARGLLTSIVGQIRGQLIITTHMTGLLRKDKDGTLPIPEDMFYFISSNPDIKRSIKCLTEVEKRRHKNYNYQDHYYYNEIFEQYIPQMDDRINDRLKNFACIGND